MVTFTTSFGSTHSLQKNQKLFNPSLLEVILKKLQARQICTLDLVKLKSIAEEYIGLIHDEFLAQILTFIRTVKTLDITFTARSDM